MEIRPIRTKKDHKRALAEVERLWGFAHGTPEADRLEVLAVLIEDYETRHYPVAAIAPIDVLKHAISDMGRSQKELAEILGSRSHASEVLSGRRKLSVTAIAKISKAWHIPAELLIGSADGLTAAE